MKRFVLTLFATALALMLGIVGSNSAHAAAYFVEGNAGSGSYGLNMRSCSYESAGHSEAWGVNKFEPSFRGYGYTMDVRVQLRRQNDNGTNNVLVTEGTLPSVIAGSWGSIPENNWTNLTPWDWGYFAPGYDPYLKFDFWRSSDDTHLGTGYLNYPTGATLVTSGVCFG